jgi:GTP-binding protein
MEASSTEALRDEVPPVRPIVSIVGRPNVGKSTLFNRLTRSRDAIVDDRPGVTRDRIFGVGRLGSSPFWIVDTGGIESDGEIIHDLMGLQVDAALADSDAVIFMVDGRADPGAVDMEIASRLRKNSGKTIYLAVNKAEGLDRDIVGADFYALGLGTPAVISSKNGDGVRELMDTILASVSAGASEYRVPQGVPAIVVAGRPNVGKSTLVNTLLGEERVVVYDDPGTTRDSIYVPFSSGDKDYVLVDTAGVRRKSRIEDKIEIYSVMKALRALEHAQVALIVFDARTGIVEQDARLINLVQERGRSLLILVNKWDSLDSYTRSQVKKDMERKFRYLGNVPVLYISATKGAGLGEIMPLVDKVYKSSQADLGTGKLNRLLQKAVENTAPPMIGFRRIKLKYAHQGGKNPPHIILHGNQVDKIPQTYKRYLAGVFENGFELLGTRVKLTFRSSRNPYSKKAG